MGITLILVTIAALDSPFGTDVRVGPAWHGGAGFGRGSGFLDTARVEGAVFDSDRRSELPTASTLARITVQSSSGLARCEAETFWKATRKVYGRGRAGPGDNKLRVLVVAYGVGAGSRCGPNPAVGVTP